MNTTFMFMTDYDITMASDVARDIHYDVTMNTGTVLIMPSQCTMALL